MWAQCWPTVGHSTLGSVVRPVLIGYVLYRAFRIPDYADHTGILIALAAVYLIVWALGWRKCAVACAGDFPFFGYSGLRGQFGDTMKHGGVNWDILYRANSNYGELQGGIVVVRWWSGGIE